MKKWDGEIAAPLTKPGTRHDRMVAMAVHLRREGRSRDECIAVLQEWYLEQPPEMIHSSRAEVMRDIGKIIDWAFGESFTAPCRPQTSIPITADEMALACSQPDKTMRKLFFAILARQKAGRSRISCSDLSGMIGMSLHTTQNAIKRLADAGAIIITRGRARRTNKGALYMPCNAYRINTDYQQKGGVTFGRTDTAQVEVDVSSMRASFKPVYYAAVHALLPEKDIRAFMTRKEYEEYTNAVEAK